MRNTGKFNFKEIIKKIAFIFVLIVIGVNVSITSYAQTVGTTQMVTLGDNTFVAWKEISNIKLTLSNGQIVARAGINSTIEENTQKIETPVAIYFVIDESGSMSGSKIEAVKGAMKDITQKIFEEFTNFKIGIIGFSGTNLEKYGDSNDHKIYLSLIGQDEIDKNKVEQAIDELTAGGGTNISNALETARAKLGNENEYKKMIITLTDGAISDGDDTKKILSSIVSEGIIVNAIFYDTDVDIAFEEIPDDNKYIADDIERFFKEELLEKLKKQLITYSNPQSNLEFNNENMFFVGDTVFIIMDNELLQGATLEIEYKFTIKAGKDVKKFIICDYINNKLQYDENASFEDGTKINKDYGWKIYDDSKIYISKEGDKIIEEGTDYTCRLKLSIVIAPNQEVSVDNSAHIYIEDMNGEVYKSSNENIMKSFKVTIIPPFGKKKEFMDIRGILVIIGIVLITAIALYTIKRKKG